MTIELEYVYGPGYISADGFDIHEKRGSKLNTILTLYPKGKTDHGKKDAEDAAQCICLLLMHGVGPEELTRLLASKSETMGAA